MLLSEAHKKPHGTNRPSKAVTDDDDSVMHLERACTLFEFYTPKSTIKQRAQSGATKILDCLSNSALVPDAASTKFHKSGGNPTKLGGAWALLLAPSLIL